MSTANVLVVPAAEFLRLFGVWIVGVLAVLSVMTFIDLWNHRAARR
ncbi:MAG: hypothetical protein R3B09_24055 [Nannocystaceae bacterium]